MYLYCISNVFVLYLYQFCSKQYLPPLFVWFRFPHLPPSTSILWPLLLIICFFYCISTALLLYLCCISNVFVLYLYQFCIVFVLNLYCICTTKHQHHVAAPPPHPFLPHMFPSLFVLFGFCPSWKKLCDHIIVQDPLVRLLIILYKYNGPMKT